MIFANCRRRIGPTGWLMQPMAALTLGLSYAAKARRSQDLTAARQWLLGVRRLRLQTAEPR